MSTAGIFNSSNFSPSQACDSFASMILMKMPNGTAPLFGFTSQLKSKTINSHRHVFGAKDWQYPELALTSSLPPAAPGSITSINVASSELVVPNQIYQVMGGEQVRVVSVPAPNVVVVQRGLGGTISAVPLPPGTTFVHIGNAHEEASLRPIPVSTHGYEYENITQIFRDSWAVSGTVAEECVRMGEHPIIGNKKEGAMMHATGIEKSLFFGRKYSGVLNGMPYRTMSGLIEFIENHAPGNISVAGAQTTYSQLEEMLDPAFSVVTDMTQRNDRVLFVGNIARKVINRIGREFGQLNMTMGETSFGMQFERFKTYRGEFIIVEHPLFNTNPDWARMAVAVDLSSITTCYLGKRKTTHRPFNRNVNENTERDAVDNGIDAEGGTFLTEMTVEFAAPEANAVIFGLCEAACEPCKELVNAYNATFYVDRPCIAGKVAPNSAVTLFIEGAAPSTTIPIITPTGVVNVTTDASGNGSVTYTVGTAPLYTFHVMQTAGNLNTRFNPAIANVCVQQPCDITQPCNDPACPPVVNPKDLQPASADPCAVGEADPHLHDDGTVVIAS